MTTEATIAPAGVLVDAEWAQQHLDDPAVRVVRDDVRERLGDRTFALVDVRSPAEYSGELFAPAALPQEGAQRAGHIPGAASIPWSSAVNEDGTFKSVDELRNLYGSKGITS